MTAPSHCSDSLYGELADFIRRLYGRPEGGIPLHAPVFSGRERELLMDCIDSTYVSSVGAHVDRLEEMICELTGAGYCTAVVNGTAALHLALLIAGVRPGDEVITQPLSFVATANAIAYCNARPVFLDVEERTLGLSPEAVASFLQEQSETRAGECFNRKSGRRIAACVPMHTFGHPCRVDELLEVCRSYGIPLIEDAAESLGSRYRGRHTGTFGLAGIFSFNGNKIITGGGGGAIITSQADFARRAKFLSTTAKVDNLFFDHSEIGYNYRMPNINAALVCAQLEQLDFFLKEKRRIAASYGEYLQHSAVKFISEPRHARSNYWLNAVLLPDRAERDGFLRLTNERHICTRPAWKLLNTLPMYATCLTDGLQTATQLATRLVNLPSGVRR